MPPDDSLTGDQITAILLPPELRKRWIVVPRVYVYSLIVFMFVFGAGSALLIVGWSLNIGWMSVPLMVTLVVPHLFKGRVNRFDKQLDDEVKRYAATKVSRSTSS